MRVRYVATTFLVRSLVSFPSISPNSLSFVASAMSTSVGAGAPPSMKNNVRIVSYNLLSSKLSRASHFTRADPEHLEYENRLPLILSKLEDAMKSCDLNSNDDDTSSKAEDSSAPPAIFALQEVCYPFASELHTFFANRGYHFVTGLYGRPFNGYV